MDPQHHVVEMVQGEGRRVRWMHCLLHQPAESARERRSLRAEGLALRVAPSYPIHPPPNDRASGTEAWFRAPGRHTMADYRSPWWGISQITHGSVVHYLVINRDVR